MAALSPLKWRENGYQVAVSRTGDMLLQRAAILKALAIGDMSFAMIHDSFGVHAADMPVFLQDCIKPAFVEMYERGDNLETFKKEISLNIKETGELRPLPPKGSLVIEEVLESQFFFS